MFNSQWDIPLPQVLVSYAQNFEDVVLWRALGHLGKGFFVEIGAQDPVVDSVSLAFHEHGWRGVHVEPVPHYAALLRTFRPGDVILQAAVSSRRGALKLFSIPDTGLTTADREIAERHAAFGFNVQEIMTRCITLTDVFSQCAGSEIHWLKIDVEGHEQRVLRGWPKKTRVRPWIVVVESRSPLTQLESHGEWEPLLLGRGYRFVYFDGLNRFYVSETHPELRDAFRVGPNLFDNFTLNGTASAPFCMSLNGKRQALEMDLARRQQALAEKGAAIRGLTQAVQERDAAVAHLQAHHDTLQAALAQRERALAEGLNRIQGRR